MVIDPTMPLGPLPLHHSKLLPGCGRNAPGAAGSVAGAETLETPSLPDRVVPCP